MTGIAIYMEGGGDGRATKEALRQGMDALLRPLKQAAREKALHWKLVCCGGRSETFRRFRNEVTTASDTFVVLLVDAGESVHGSPCAHLHACDGWDMGFADDDAVHLMVQVMEALPAFVWAGFHGVKFPPPQGGRGSECSAMPNHAEPRTAMWESDIIAWRGCHNPHQILKRQSTLDCGKVEHLFVPISQYPVTVS